jgi:hypothetical protein
MISRGYVYVHVCCRDLLGQRQESGSVGREGWGEGHGYFEVLRW